MTIVILIIPLIDGIWVWGCKDLLVVNLLNLTEPESGGFLWIYWFYMFSYFPFYW